MILVTLSILALLLLIPLIPLSLGYFFNTSWIRPFLWIPAESASLLGIPFLLKPTSSIFYELPYASKIGLLILYFLFTDIYFKALVFVGGGCRREEGPMAQTLATFIYMYGQKFGVYFKDLARLVLRLAHILLDCAGALGHSVLCFGMEVEDDRDLESQTHVGTPTIV